MVLDTNIQSYVTRAATESKALRTLINGNAADLTSLTTTSKTNLVSAINEVKAGLGGGSFATLSDVAVSSLANNDYLTYNSTTSKWNNHAATTYGLAFLSLANQAALLALLPTGTTGGLGVLQLASSAQTVTGTDTALATTSAGTKAAIDGRIVNDGTLAGNSTTNAPSQASVVTYVAARIAALDIFAYKGVIDASTTPNYPASNAGDVYRISVAGKIGGASGPNVEPGDMLFALTDGTAAGTQATVGAQWDIVQVNVDGAVVGPASSVAGDFATFSNTTGKVVQDSGVSIDTDGTLTANSNVRIPSQAAVKTYADTKQTADTELTALAGTTSAANKVPYFTGSGTASTTDFLADGRTLVGAANFAAMRGSGLLNVWSQTEVGPVTTDYVALFNAGLV